MKAAPLSGRAVQCGTRTPPRRAPLVQAGLSFGRDGQPGGKELRERGYQVESLAIVDSMDPETGDIVFA